MWHINETCGFYFEDKDINFVVMRILYSDPHNLETIYGIRLTFQKFQKTYDIFIIYERTNFIINYFYKAYYKKRRKGEFDFLSFVEDPIRGSDIDGFYRYLDLGGESSGGCSITPYDISESIENIINFHSDKNDDDDDEGGENDPCEPFSPCDEVEPEIIKC
jgi:hypothetical protein